MAERNQKRHDRCGFIGGSCLGDKVGILVTAEILIFE